MRAYFTIGIPGSGKSAWSNKLISEKGKVINFSRTDIRNSMIKKKNRDLFDIPKEVRTEVNSTVDELSKLISQVCKLDIVFDNTNLVWSRLCSNASHYYNMGWDITFVVFPVENIEIKQPSQEKMIDEYKEMFCDKHKERFDNFIDAYGIEVIYITNEEQNELLRNGSPTEQKWSW